VDGDEDFVSPTMSDAVFEEDEGDGGAIFTAAAAAAAAADAIATATISSPKKASNFSAILSEQASNGPKFSLENYSASSGIGTAMTVFPGTISLAERLDAAVNKASASRKRARKRTEETAPTAVDGNADARGEGESSTDANANASQKTGPLNNSCNSDSKATGDEEPIRKKPWQQRARETNWNDNKSILQNFPPYRDKSKGYGSSVPPPYMLSHYDDVLLKAHAVSAWNKFTKAEQFLLKKQFAEMRRREVAEEKKRRRELRKLERKARTKARNAKKREEKKAEMRRLKDESETEEESNLSNAALIDITKTTLGSSSDNDATPTTQINLQVRMKDGGTPEFAAMVRALLDTGDFDDIVLDRMRVMENADGASPPNENITLQIIEGDDSSRAMMAKKMREMEQQRKRQQQKQQQEGDLECLEDDSEELDDGMEDQTMDELCQLANM